MTAALEPIDVLSAFRLEGKVAIVTGASSGFGVRAARVLDGLGASVVVSARAHRSHRGTGRVLAAR